MENGNAGFYSDKSNTLAIKTKSFDYRAEIGKSISREGVFTATANDMAFLII